jgi:hypothetical protein
MRSNLEMVAKPLGISESTVADLHARWSECAQDWKQRG